MRCARIGFPWIGFPWIGLVILLAGVAGLGCRRHGSHGGVLIVSNPGGLRVVVVSDCPRCDDPAADDSFGSFFFFSNVTRQTARDIQAVCGFGVARDHAGASGDALQIASCGGGVELAFASNGFSAFALRTGFVGRFGNGIRIGDPLREVLARDPGLVQVDPSTFLRDDGTRRVEANFDANMRLRELVVGRGFLR
jgi:hypothetical protein